MTPQTRLRLDRLRGLWAEGHSLDQCAALMEVSRNVIAGLCHRYALPKRPLPRGFDRVVTERRNRSEEDREAARARSAAARIAKRAEMVAAKREQQSEEQAARQEGRAKRAREAHAQREGAGAAPACCFPIGDPGKPDFRFCGAPAVRRRPPYCAEHVEAAYVPPRAARQ